MKVEPLPHTTISKILGLLQVLKDHNGKEDIYKLAQELNMEFGELLTVIKAAEMLEFVTTPGGDVELNDLGKEIIVSSINKRKKIVKEQLKKIGLFDHMIHLLTKTEVKRLEKEFIVEELALILPQENPELLFQTLVNWSRYGKIFSYNHDAEELCLIE